MVDIIDTIDAVIDEQLEPGEQPWMREEFPRCFHCGREWHGLPITERMEHMRRAYLFDESYRFSEDDSVVLCRGSDFIGPQLPEQSVRSRGGTGVDSGTAFPFYARPFGPWDFVVESDGDVHLVDVQLGASWRIPV